MSKDKPVESKRNAAYSAAVTRLKEMHHDDFVVLVQEEYEKRGLTYKRRLSPEEKARQQIADLFAEFPALHDEFAA